jgi:hypothetical protein
MTLEKHNMLYAVQFALHEFDETGAVSRRTMEMLGARAILLRYEIEGEVANAMAKKEPPKPRTAERGSRVNSASFALRNAHAITGKQTIGTRPANITCVITKN